MKESELTEMVQDAMKVAVDAKEVDKIALAIDHLVIAAELLYSAHADFMLFDRSELTAHKNKIIGIAVTDLSRTASDTHKAASWMLRRHNVIEETMGYLGQRVRACQSK